MTDEQYNPSDYTVDEVNAYLAEHPDAVAAVLTAEEDGQARKGILEGPHATPAEDGTTPGLVTKADTIQEAGAKATEPEGEAYQKGYFGHAPSRDGDKPVDLTLAGVTGQNKDA